MDPKQLTYRATALASTILIALGGYWLMQELAFAWGTGRQVDATPVTVAGLVVVAAGAALAWAVRMIRRTS